MTCKEAGYDEGIIDGYTYKSMGKYIAGTENSRITFITDGKHNLAYHSVNIGKIKNKLESEEGKCTKRKEAIELYKKFHDGKEPLVEEIYPNLYKETKEPQQHIENHKDFDKRENIEPKHVLAQLLAWIDFEPHKLTKINQDAVKNIFDGETNSSGEKILGLKDYGFEKKDVEDAVEKACKKKGGTTWKDYEAGEAIELTRKEIADSFLWNEDLMKIVGTNGGTLNVALFQAFALRMGGSGETMITPTQQRKNDLIRQLNQKIRDNKTPIYDPDTQQYTKTIKNKKRTTTLILTD